MGTLKKLKAMLEADRILKSKLLAATAKELLLDTDGDGFADIYLLDTMGGGDIDALALELKSGGAACLCFTSDGYFLLDDEGSGDIGSLGLSAGLSDALLETGPQLLDAISAGQCSVSAFDDLSALLERTSRELRCGAAGS